MAEKLPNEIFNRPALSENPHRVDRADGQVVRDVYNLVLGRLIGRSIPLENRLARGGFNRLGAIRAKEDRAETLTEADQLLIEDFTTLLDSRVAAQGRRVLNIANDIARFNQMESNGVSLDPQLIEIREQYQAGDFQLIRGGNHPIERDLTLDRFTVPVRDGDENFAIFDGAPVEGLIRFIDRELRELAVRRDLSQDERNAQANDLRFQRNVLFTQSTPIFAEQDRVTHARNQLESYYIYNDPILSQWELPDWLGGENLLAERRVLNIPERGRRRWGCLPLLLPLPFLIPLCTSISTSPCQDSGGDLTAPRLEVFSSQPGQTPSLKGAIEREMSYPGMGVLQTEYKDNADPNLISERDRLQADLNEYYQAYLEIAEGDYLKTAQRVRGDHQDTPWIKASDFAEKLVLASCSSPEQRDQKAKEAVNRSNHPNLIADTWNRVTRLFPRFDVTIR